MGYKNFRELELAYSEPYSQGNFREAIEILEEGSHHLPRDDYDENLFAIMSDKARCYFRLKDNDGVYETLNELTDAGYICQDWLINQLPLEEEAHFMKLKEKNDLLREQKRKLVEFKYEVHLPHGYTEEKKYPLFFNLHGDGDDIEAHKYYWKPDILLEKGFIVVYPQASQLLHHNGYGWCERVTNMSPDEKLPDPSFIYEGRILKRCYNASYDEIRTCYEEVSKTYSIDEKCIVIGGMSGGATASVDFTMSHTIPIRGFIALCPELQPMSCTEDSVHAATRRGVRGVFMEGQEMMPVADEEEMVKLFEKAGLPYKYFVNKGIGHWYPEDLDKKVEEGLNFILK